jgi:BCD family chlorophyll transporter-like MFS transporter
MNRVSAKLARGWMLIGPQFLPFADAASTELPLGRLLRLSLFQVSVGMATALLIGTLNRVIIVELGVSAWLVALMVSLPLVFAPFRALIGFRSDNHRSVLGWRRVPYIWMGSLLQFGGLAIMPFALIILSGDTHGPIVIGQIASALAFLLVGAGLQTTQTAGLALATDLAPDHTRPRVIALMYVMLLLGMVASGIAFGLLLAHFTQLQLVKVIQGAACITMVLNSIALWKQEARNPERTSASRPQPVFRESWRAFIQTGRARRFLVTVGLGTAAFSMQEIVLEPYGAEVLKLSVSATTSLTALLAAGALVAFACSARLLARGANPHKLAAHGVLIGLIAFSAVIFAAPLASPGLFRIGTCLIGLGSGFFSVGMLAGAMARERNGESGLALGAWGAVQATAAGIAIALGGALADIVSRLAQQGLLGEALTGPDTGYGFVYHIEVGLLFATLIAIGPLVRSVPESRPQNSSSFGLAGFPG